ncbi:antitermination protein NusB [Mycobacterium sp.]|uniref:antitermination protein NusB n=1 Tax=Mycobacterium sp. TaxID=1785 RepID=UPI002C3F3515|nr:antitermination protein NusB [Mycobacterium sp.]HME49875.1 antitermination protein NusB [Mycobacterium sp.]
MNRHKVRILVASILAASVVLGAVFCAAFGWAVIAAALAIYALGAWLYHSIERYVVAKRVNTVIVANRLNPVRSAARPLLPVMAAIMGLTQGVVNALSDTSELDDERRELPVWRLTQITRGPRGTRSRRGRAQ